MAVARKAKRNKDRGETAQRILDAADSLLGEGGFEGISARDIARRAGVNKALVFYHFGSVDAVFERVLDRYYAKHHALLAEVFEPADAERPLAERLHKLVDAYIDFIEHNRLYPRLVQQQISGGGQHVEMVQRHLRAFFDWTRTLLAEVAPDVGAASVRQLYVTFSGAVINYFTYAPLLGDDVFGGDPLRPEALAERRAHVHWLVDALLDGVARTQA